MTAEDKKYLTFGGVGILVLIILWLLHKQAPLVTNVTNPAAINQENVTLGSPTYSAASPGDISLMTPQQIALNLSFPPDNFTTTSCDCGCDTNGPVNAAFQAVANTINQYNEGLLQITDASIKAYSAAVPDWMAQYINSGGMVASGNGYF